MTISFLDEVDSTAYGRSLLVGGNDQSCTIVARVGIFFDSGNCLRIDVAEADECTCFQDVRMAGTKAYIGFGERLFVVDLITEDVVTHQMDGYFGHIYDPEELDYSGSDFSMLASSASELLAFDLEGALLWKTTRLAIDGVIVHEVSPAGIRGNGEWDPPDGWEPFVLLARTGERISGGIEPQWPT